MPIKPCKVVLDGLVECGRPKMKTKQVCRWHWLLKQPIEVQARAAKERLVNKEQPMRLRVPSNEWPPGERWCAGCQSFVPAFYVQGSRCKACGSVAAHHSHVQRTYEISGEEYEALLEWQGGRCYICRQVPRVRRLAVDHDHRTGVVRGLLCANDDWGCNVTLARLLNDPEAGVRLAEYASMPPLERMRRGDPPKPKPATESAFMRSLREWQPPAPEPVQGLEDWQPFD